ncbi:MAG: hypothetical protein DDT22_00913 [candidate division WS2 bacterium]|nr:hypothetical protein [Candidatus Lithacetigena glycinireducens]MBT9175239.1 hypothetical protein [Candidatus Lithacetigena glycinireducens]
MELKNLTTEELQKLLAAIQEEIASRNGKRTKIHLAYHNYKGSGKCWVARVDEDKKILSFVDAHAVVRNGNHKGEKVFYLADGLYLTCEVGSKTQDDRRYIRVQDSTITEW